MRAGFVVLAMGFAVFAGVFACGEEYGETDPGPSSSSSSGGSSSGTNPAETEPTVAASPGKIECGKESCDVATQHCCVAGSNDLKCKAKDDACGGNDSTASCDDSADCTDPAKKICCGQLTGLKSNVSCVEKCSGLYSSQTCRTDDECGGQKCVHQSCFGFSSWLCGLSSFCQKL